MTKKRIFYLTVWLSIIILPFLLGISYNRVLADKGDRSEGIIEGIVIISSGFGIVDSVNLTASNPDSSYTTNPDSTGSYQFMIPAGVYSITAILENYEDSTITQIEVVENQTTSNIDFLLNPILGSIQGNVTIANGSGWVEDVDVSAGEITVNPDPFGNYEISLPAGSYDVTAHINPSYYDSTIVGVSVLSDQVTTGVDFSLESIPGYLEGSVSLEAGGSGDITNVNIIVGEIVGHPNSEGNFNFPVVPGTYSVQAGMPGYEIQEIDTTITANDTTQVNFNLQYLPEPADIWLENLSSEYIATIAWEPIPQTDERKSQREEPIFQSYTVWRRHYLETWDDWEIIAQNVLDSTYSDNLQQQPDGTYLYGVQAIYDIGASVIARSYDTQLTLDRFVEFVNISITTNDGSSPSAVSYNLQGLDQIYSQNFSGQTSTTGTVTLNDVYKTNYAITLSKTDYQTLTDTITITDSTNEFSFVLQEEYIPPSEITTVLTDTFSVDINWSGNVRYLRSALYYSLYRKFDQEDWIVLQDSTASHNFLDDLKNEPDGNYKYGVQTVYTTGSSDTLNSDSINIFRYVDAAINVTLSDGNSPDSVSYAIVGMDSIYHQEFSGTTQNSGVIDLSEIFMSEYAVTLTRATYDTLTDTLSISNQGQQINLTMDALPGKIEGFVDLDDGEGNITNVEISLGTLVVNPDTSGFYSITLPAGVYSLSASLTGYTDSTITEIEVKRGEITNDINFDLLPIKASPTLYIFQNPYLINYVQFAANIVQSVADSVRLKLNSQEVELTELAVNSYIGNYHFTQPGEYVITFTTFNSGGDSTITRFFSVIQTDKNGGSGSSPDHKFTINLGQNCLPENNFIVITDSTLINPIFTKMDGIYRVGVNGMNLNAEAEVSFDHNSPDKAIFQYKNDSWHELPTVFDLNGLHAKVYETGFFRIMESDNTQISTMLSQNFPNPFRTQTEIKFTIRSVAENITLAVYNIKGQLVRNICNGSFEAGVHSAKWDGINSSGTNCSPGIYFIMLTTPQKAITQKMIYLK